MTQSILILLLSLVFFFNDTATTEIYTLSLHDALPISKRESREPSFRVFRHMGPGSALRDRKSTRLNSSHVEISYAVFCLKKKHRRSGETAVGVGGAHSTVWTCRTTEPAGTDGARVRGASQRANGRFFF